MWVVSHVKLVEDISGLANQAEACSFTASEFVLLVCGVNITQIFFPRKQGASPGQVLR